MGGSRAGSHTQSPQSTSPGRPHPHTRCLWRPGRKGPSQDPGQGWGEGKAVPSQQGTGLLRGTESPHPPQPYTQDPEASASLAQRASLLRTARPPPPPQLCTCALARLRLCAYIQTLEMGPHPHPHPVPGFLRQEVGPAQRGVPTTFLALRGPEHSQVEVVLRAGPLATQALGLWHSEPVLRHGAAPPLLRSVLRPPGAELRPSWYTGGFRLAPHGTHCLAQLPAELVWPLPARWTPSPAVPAPGAPPRPAHPPPPTEGRRKVAPPPRPHPGPHRNRKPRGFLTHPARHQPRGTPRGLRGPGTPWHTYWCQDHTPSPRPLQRTPHHGGGGLPECGWAQGAPQATPPFRASAQVHPSASPPCQLGPQAE